MKIRRADIFDVGALVAMMERFHKAKEPRFEFSESDARASITGLLSHDMTFISDGGFIAGMMAPALTNRTVFTAFEVLWWAENGQGPRLRRVFEEDARQKGCRFVNFSHPAEEIRVNAMLSRAGYLPATVAMERAV